MLNSHWSDVFNQRILREIHGISVISNQTSIIAHDTMMVMKDSSFNCISSLKTNANDHLLVADQGKSFESRVAWALLRFIVLPALKLAIVFSPLVIHFVLMMLELLCSAQDEVCLEEHTLIGGMLHDKLSQVIADRYRDIMRSRETTKSASVMLRSSSTSSLTVSSPLRPQQPWNRMNNKVSEPSHSRRRRYNDQRRHH